MENLDFSLEDGQMRIQGFDDALAVVALRGAKARRLADLSLHLADLEFASACLDSINFVSDKPYTIQKALWSTAITYFIKCFGGGARFQLSEIKIYRTDAVNALESFNYFKDLRNKHVVHDENSFAQANPGAIIANKSKPHKIEKIVCPMIITVSLEQPAYANLKLLIEQATKWVVSEYDSYCNQLATELELLDHEVLLTMPTLRSTPAQSRDVGNRRDDIGDFPIVRK